MRTIFLLKQNLFLRDHVYWNTDSGDVIKKARIHSNVNNIYHIHICNQQDCSSIQMVNVWDFGGVSHVIIVWNSDASIFLYSRESATELVISSSKAWS